MDRQQDTSRSGMERRGQGRYAMRAPRLLCLSLTLLVSLLAVVAIANAQETGPVEVPEGKLLFGFNLDWSSDNVGGLDLRIGAPVPALGRFVEFQLAPEGTEALDAFMADLVARGRIAILTVEPQVPLGDIDEAMATEFAARMAAFNEVGVPVMLRFAPEMNGAWHPWGQHPAAYIEAFRLVADAVHESAPATAMLWSANYGGGSPFAGPYAAVPGTPEFDRLDTDQDGQLTALDDPYEPYYPGDAYVDWVGLGLFYWGNSYPWGENEIPEAGRFVAQITGSFIGATGDESALPDFYGVYVTERGKPLAISTAALFILAAGGDDHVAIKQGWWQQLSEAKMTGMEGLQFVEWFEWRRADDEVDGAVIDWMISLTERVRSAFRGDLQSYAALFNVTPAN